MYVVLESEWNIVDYLVSEPRFGQVHEVFRSGNWKNDALYVLYFICLFLLIVTTFPLVSSWCR